MHRCSSSNRLTRSTCASRSVACNSYVLFFRGRHTDGLWSRLTDGGVLSSSLLSCSKMELINDPMSEPLRRQLENVRRPHCREPLDNMRAAASNSFPFVCVYVLQSCGYS